MANRSLSRSLAVATACMLALSACGSDDEGAEPTTSQAASATSTTAAESTTTIEATTTTAPPARSLAEIGSDIVAAAEAAATSPDGDALAVARDVIAIPYDLPVPGGGRFFEARLDGRLVDGVVEWEWNYGAVAPDGVGDIDKDAPDNGPGAVALLDFYGELLGPDWRTTATVVSEPREGGPQSINNVWQSEGATVDVGGVEHDIARIRVWADENLRGGPDDTDQGYEVELHTETTDRAPAHAALAALDDVITLPEGAELVLYRIEVRRPRDPESFSAEFGLVAVDVSVTHRVEGDLASVRPIYEGEFGTELVPGRISFGDSIDDADFQEIGDGIRRNLVLDRTYEGELDLDPTDDGFVDIRHVVTFEVLREPIPEDQE